MKSMVKKKKRQEFKLAAKLKSGRLPYVILICGMPGTRKSSTAIKVGAALDFASVVGMDELRDVMRLYDKGPMIQGKSHDRWKLFGNLNDRNFKKGFVGQARVLRYGILAIIKKQVTLGENVIAEGVHLLPSLYKKINGARVIHILLTSKNFNHHTDLLNYKFDRRHGRQKKWDLEKIIHVGRIQKLLISDAHSCDVFMIQSSDPEKNCQKIINLIDRIL